MLTMTPDTDALTPQPGESQADYVDRVWDHVPVDSDIEKAKWCRDAWFGSGNDSQLLNIARRRFPSDRYQHITGSAVFKEHSTTRKHEGQESTEVYGRDEIEAICRRNNERIASTEDFAPLCEGHTPDQYARDRGVPQPKVLGYAGPYYLGKLNGQFAIFCDEHHHRDEAENLEKLQRRSPEIWLEERMDKRFFDPIACLGAETPRLDLGMTRYGRNVFSVRADDGAELMKYAAPAAGSVYVPTEKYGAEPMALSPEDLSQIVEAISGMEQFQVLEQLAPVAGKLVEMANGGGPGPMIPGGGGDAGGIGLEGDNDGLEVNEPPSAYEPDDDDKSMLSRYMAGDCGDDEMSQYMAGKRDKYMGGAQPAAMPTQYSKSAAADQARIEKARYERENEGLRRRVEVLERDKREAERYQKLTAKQAEGFVFDLEDELNDTRDMNDQQFERHLARIERYERAPLSDQVPALHTPPLQKGQVKQTEDYQRERAEWAVNYAQANQCSYDEAVAEFEKQHAA